MGAQMYVSCSEPVTLTINVNIMTFQLHFDVSLLTNIQENNPQNYESKY